MKKKNLKSLGLNKQFIANFSAQIKGGTNASQPCNESQKSLCFPQDSGCFVRESENQSCYGGETCQAC